MPWKATDLAKSRMRFLAEVEEGIFSHAEACERHGISRQTGYTLRRRYSEEGVEGLKDRSRAPKHSPQRIPEEVQAMLLEVRQAHPKWGPRTILSYVQKRHTTLELPAASTVGDLFKRAGLVKSSPRPRKWRHPGRSSLVASEPNQLWSTDFKGQFRTSDGKLCYPLTVADARTRFLLACDGLSSTGHQGAQEVFERLFRTYGLPEAIRSDNGGPFATKAIGGLSRLSVWWTKLGIKHDRIQRGHPEQNGSHERMHRTLKSETLLPPAANGREQQARFDAFALEFNYQRPHHALEMKTPGSLYVDSPRAMPERIARPEYPGHCLAKQVRANGILYFLDRAIFLSELLIGEEVGLEEIGDGVWSIYFYDLLLARLDERTFSISG